MNTVLSFTLARLLLVTLTLGALVPSAAFAQGLRARVHIVPGRLPAGMSEQQLLAHARRAASSRLRESDEAELDERGWNAELVIQFNRAPNDTEFHVLFYDTQDDTPRFVEDLSVYVNDRRERTYVHRIRLRRPRFRPNRRMEMVVTVRRDEVARESFQLVGEERERTGEVSFSDEETDPRQRRDPGHVDPAAASIELPAQDPDPTVAAPPPRRTAPPPAARSESGRSGGLCMLGAAREMSWGALALPFAAMILAGRRRRRPR